MVVPLESPWRAARNTSAASVALEFAMADTNLVATNMKVANSIRQLPKSAPSHECVPLKRSFVLGPNLTKSFAGFLFIYDCESINLI